MSEEGIKVNPYGKGGEAPKDNCCLDIEDTVYKSGISQITSTWFPPTLCDWTHLFITY